MNRTIAPAAGDQQVGDAGAPPSVPLTVLVTDPSGRPAAGVAVHWRALNGSLLAPPASVGDEHAHRPQTGRPGGGAMKYQMQTRHVLAILPAAFAIFLSACRDDGVEPSPLASSTGPIILAVSPQDVSGIAGELVEPAPRVRVVDEQGRPLAFEPVRFVVSLGGGRLAQADTLTDAFGEAHAQWILGKAYQLNELSVHSRSNRDVLRFTALSRAGRPVQIVELARPEDVGLAGDVIGAPVVMVLDADGNGVANVEVDFAATNGGRVGGASATRITASGCCPAGIATPRTWLLGQSGINHVIASVAGVKSDTFDVVAIDSAAATWYSTLPEYDDMFGVLQSRLALSASGHFIEDATAFYNGSLHRNARFAGRYAVASGTLTLNGCSLSFDDRVCYAKTGSMTGDSIRIGSQYYYKRVPATPLPPAFPAVTRAARIYEGVDSPYYSYHGSKLASRYVLYDDRTFALQYASARWGVFEYLGRYTEIDSVITFDWDGWSVAGAWGATGTLNSDALTVRYNIIMQLSDFEDGVYVRKR